MPEQFKRMHTKASKNDKFTYPFPILSELHSRKLLDEYLSRALSVELEDRQLTLIDDSAYVLTLDYTIKMLNIHERFVVACIAFYLPRSCTCKTVFSAIIYMSFKCLFFPPISSFPFPPHAGTSVVCQ